MINNNPVCELLRAMEDNCEKKRIVFIAFSFNISSKGAKIHWWMNDYALSEDWKSSTQNVGINTKE